MQQHSIARWLSVPGLLLCGAVSAADEAAIAQCAAVDNPTARLACYDAAAGRPVAPGGAVPAPAAPAPVAPDADSFGKSAPAHTEKLQARIAGKFTEWKYGTLIKLDNGQVWQSLEERSAVYPKLPENAEVEIVRTFFGYRMEIKAIQRHLAVKRVS
jgi:hypothetical protein